MTPPRLHPALGFYPTPLHPLDRLSESVGASARIWIKRDDQTGLVTGGNKVRKLEYLIADAQRAGATRLVTIGAMQSNHARQTAAAAARVGMRCTLVLRPGARDDRDFRESGNILLDGLLGADLVLLDATDDVAEATARCLEESTRNGETPYLIPLGGSNALGALGYVRCAEEIMDSEPSFASVFVAAGSGGTQAGLLNGFRHAGDATPVIGVSVLNRSDEHRPRVHDLTQGVAELLGSAPERTPTLDDVVLDDRHLGAGYGIPTDAMLDALRLVARTEGILLDPVYSGKTMAGLLHAIRHGEYGLDHAGDVLFLHTGGQAGLWAYQSVIAGSRESPAATSA